LELGNGKFSENFVQKCLPVVSKLIVIAVRDMVTMAKKTEKCEKTADGG
jgi:hypothetical protein